MLSRSQNRMNMMWSSVWLKQNRSAVVNQGWCALWEASRITAGERSLQRDNEQAFSSNAFALKHISLFKEEHSSWMTIGAFVRLSTPHFVTDSFIMYRFCLDVQTSLFSVQYESQLHRQVTVFGWHFWDWHNLGIWGVGGRADRSSAVPGPSLGASGFLPSWGKALAPATRRQPPGDCLMSHPLYGRCEQWMMLISNMNCEELTAKLHPDWCAAFHTH